MLYQFDFRLYRRPFKQTLFTSHGNWNLREGIIVRLTDETGQVGWGEIAPIPWFGSETLEQALTFCQQLPSKITVIEVFSIPDQLPACQFGFESAWEWGSGEWGDGKRGRGGEGENILNPKSKIALSYLLPAGEAALQLWQSAWNQGSRTFKWKIGVSAIADELKVFNQLIQVLPPSAKLRLDANGGLTQQEAHQWLKAADEAGIVEFLEQPLPPGQFDAMLEMRTRYSTPIALDESVATLTQLEECYQRGWRGVFVIKAAIAGSPKRLRQLCQDYNIDAVFSSVFESAIARQAALQLAAELSNPNRAVGFGVNHWFNDDDETWLEHLWKTH
ncbi:MAG: o-succinylbenzoate synthase [Coleofasciculus sp. Co-bin14]|nr:o-succinylbenzoate synthase [Coleofasciculus sp. Co-bin14]